LAFVFALASLFFTISDFSLGLHSAVPLFHSHGIQHQHSLRRQGWNTSPAEVNYKGSVYKWTFPMTNGL